MIIIIIHAYLVAKFHEKLHLVLHFSIQDGLGWNIPPSWVLVMPNYDMYNFILLL